MIGACYCQGALQDGPTRTVRHGRFRCTSTPHDGSAPTTIVAIGRCPRCSSIRSVAGSLCCGCPYSEVRA